MSKKLKTGLKPKKDKMRLFGSEELIGLSGPVMSISGNREAAIEGCRGVVDYYENLVKLKISGGTVTFTGNGLNIITMTDESALIRGTIGNIEFDMRSDK